VLDLASKARVRQLGLIHLNQDRTDDQMDALVQDCTQFFKAKNLSTHCFAVPFHFEITL